MAQYGIAFSIPLAVATFALGDQLELVKYWLLDFNRIYAEYATMLPSLLDLALLLLIIFPVLLVRNWTPIHKVLVLGATAGLSAFVPRFGWLHLPMALPFIALIAGSVWTSRHPLRRVVIYLSLFMAIWFLVTDYWGTGESLAEWVKQETNAPEDTQMLFVPEVDGMASFYPLSGYVPAALWTPSYPWFYDDRTGIKERMMDELLANPPAYILYSPKLPAPDLLVEFMRPRYSYMARWKSGIELYRLAVPAN